MGSKHISDAELVASIANDPFHTAESEDSAVDFAVIVDVLNAFSSDREPASTWR